MTQTEILEEFRKLSPRERLEVIEAAIHLLREDLEQPVIKREQQLKIAAEVLLPDYVEGGGLTTFTALDSEEFHVQG